MAVGDIGGNGGVSGSNANSAGKTADARAQLVQLSLANVRAITAGLAPGEILTGRVGADLGGGKVALTVLGQTLVASSQTALPPDTVVKLLVHSTGDQPILRLLTATFPDIATTTTTATRAAALGLPNSSTTAIALQAFEQVGAALDPVRLKDAVAQLQLLPAAQVPQRALALGLLANAGLPTTAPFIALAERSATGVLPNPAAALAVLKTSVQTSPQQTSLMSVGEANFQQLSPQENPSPSTLARGASPQSNQRTLSKGQFFPGLTAGTTVPSTSVNTTSSSVDVGEPSLASVSLMPVSDQPIAKVTSLPVNIINAHQGNTASSPGAVTSSSSSPSAQPLGNTVLSSAPLLSSALLPSSPTVPSLLPVSASVLSSSISAVSIPLTSSVATAPTVANASLTSAATVTTASTLLGTTIPDLERDGVNAAMQALSLAGVRPRQSMEARSSPAESPLIHRLGALTSAPELPAQAKEIATRHESPIPMDAAVANVMREQVAETLVKPQALADYDVVLALPMQAQSQPTPARLAVAERHTAGGTATFVRVDAELTHLGPLSVRLSGIEGGPMAITLLGSGPALAALAAALPNLSESLRQLGLSAGLRVADLGEDHPHA
jgi:hypothetical protein